MSKLEELKKEASDLGVAFSPNIGATKLAEKIEAFYESQESTEAATEAAISTKEQEELEGQAFVEEAEKAVLKRKRTLKERARDAEKRARLTRVVEIIDNDPRVNAHTTSVTATCGNAYFDLGSIVLPLNTPVEVMQGHIDSLKEVEFPHHQMNQKTGLNNVGLRKRYTISYVQ